MSRPVIGIIGSSFLIHEDYHIFGAGKLNTSAVAEACDAIPIILPTDSALSSLTELMDLCDEEYGEQPTQAHGDFDRDRDGLALPLIRECVAAGQPIIGICRGFQEVAVAMGSTLYPEIRDLEGRDNHRMPPDGTLEEKFALRHAVTFSDDGPFRKLLGSNEVMTNTLHGQGINVAGPRIVVDGHAPDGTPEAIYVKDANGFTLSVQWHPEWNATVDPVSKPLFGAFGAACSAWRNAR